MKTLAPEFSALMIILRSTGPVISDAAVEQVFRNRRDRPFSFADSGSLGQEIGQLAGIDFLLANAAAGEQFLAALLEVFDQVIEK